MRDESQRYKKYVTKKLRDLTPIFAKASIGDFSENVELPDEDDEFTELYVGVQVMLEVIREQLSELRALNQALEQKVAVRTAALVETQQLGQIGSWEWNISNNVVTWSDELYRIYGLTPDELDITYESFLERVHPEDKALVHGIVQKAYTDLKPFSFEHRIILPDRSVKVIRAHGQVVVGDSGKPERMLGTGQDITDRKKFEDAFRDSEERYRNLFENARDVIFTISLGGTITALSPSFETTTGWPRSAWIGKRFASIVHPDDMRFTMETFRTVMHQERATTFELRIRAKTGIYLAGEFMTAPLIQKGNVVGAFGIARDVTERKLAEQQLHMLSHTITSMNECVVITDLEDRIITANPSFQRTYGYSEQEVIGKKIKILRPQHMPPSLSREIKQQTWAGGFHGELFNVRKNGEEFPIALSTSVIRDKLAIPIALVGISRDISDQRKLQTQLEETRRQRTEDLQQFAISVQAAQEEERHRIARELHDDLGQRLSGMKLTIETLEETISGSETKTISTLNNLKRQIHLMISEIRKISANLHPTALDDFGLFVAVQLLCKEFQKAQNTINLHFEANETGIEHFDAQVELALYRITQESLSNIARHSKATSATVQLIHDDSHVNLTIQDDGKGFDPLAVRKSKGKKRGLGLISMKERSEHLGGSFSITSVPEHGTTIHVEIPLHQKRK